MALQSGNPSVAASPRRITPRVEPLTVTIQSAVAMSGLSERKIKELVAGKALRSVLAGGRRLIFVASIHKLLGIEPIAQPSDTNSPHRAA